MTINLPAIGSILSTVGSWLPYISVGASLITALTPQVQPNTSPTIAALQAAIRAFALAIGHGTPAGVTPPPPPAPPAA